MSKLRKVKISQLNIYPIKSSHPVSVTSIEILKHSLKHDREWGIFGKDGQVITGRTHPQLLDIQCAIDGDLLSIYHLEKLIESIPIHPSKTTTQSLKIFSYDAYGQSVSDHLDQWFSHYLNTSCQFIRIDLNSARPVLSKHGGQDQDVVGFADQAPILILSQASLDDLNERLYKTIGTDRFRPNIVLEDTSAYEEDTIDVIQIDQCKLKVIQQVVRCVFTTIDPVSKKKDLKSEPLKTLATYRNGPKGGVVMGVHAVPINEGVISLNSEVRYYQE